MSLNNLLDGTSNSWANLRVNRLTVDDGVFGDFGVQGDLAVIGELTVTKNIIAVESIQSQEELVAPILVANQAEVGSIDVQTGPLLFSNTDDSVKITGNAAKTYTFTPIAGTAAAGNLECEFKELNGVVFVRMNYSAGVAPNANGMQWLAPGGFPAKYVPVSALYQIPIVVVQGATQEAGLFNINNSGTITVNRLNGVPFTSGQNAHLHENQSVSYLT